jgi:hypothetical protein
LTLTPPIGTSGTYGFSATASDATFGPSATANASATVVSSLTVTAAASVAGSGNNRAASIAVNVWAGTAPAVGATVTVVVTDPKGAVTTLNATTAADGKAQVKLSLRAKDPSGVYQVQATVSGYGATGSASTSFIVP